MELWVIVKLPDDVSNVALVPDDRPDFVIELGLHVQETPD